MIRFFFSSPPITRSTASRKSWRSMVFFFFRAAIRAASLQMLAMSAPENPGVCLARNSTSTEVSSFRGFRCTWKMAMRSLRSGMST